MKQRKKVFSGKFVAGIVIYAVVFMALVGAGLGVFWKFIEAYELSRPKNTLKNYVEQLTVDEICAGANELYDSVSSGLQSPKQFRQVIADSLTGELNYAKKSSESTADRQVYVLRSGKTPIGEFAIAAGEEDSFGFRRWTVQDQSFDFSHLIGEPVSITVPSEYKVFTADRVLLDENSITEENIHYSALEEFYGDYTLPTMTTYTADGYFGEITLQAMDPSGNIVEITPDTDMNDLLPKCSPEEEAQVETLAKEFIRLWVAFSGSTKDTSAYHYYNIKNVLSSDGVLATRLYTALDGLSYGQSSGATIQDIKLNRIVPVEGAYYMCDVTYLVQAIGRQGAVDTTSNMKLMLSTENGILKVKSMQRY